MNAKVMALGGVTAALAVIIMCLGGIIPVATFICPVLCCILLQICLKGLGIRGAWVWYSAVSLLVLLLGPDKEAAAVFVVLGYYPIIRSRFPKGICGWLAKLIYFDCSIFVLYWLLLRVFGIAQVVADYSGLGMLMGGILILLGNVTFIMLDRLLKLYESRFEKRYG